MTFPARAFERVCQAAGTGTGEPGLQSYLGSLPTSSTLAVGFEEASPALSASIY